MADWLQQQESEYRQWIEEGWWRTLDTDPNYHAWLEAMSVQLTKDCEQERTDGDRSQKSRQ